MRCRTRRLVYPMHAPPTDPLLLLPLMFFIRSLSPLLITFSV